MKTKITIHDVPEVVGYIQKAMADKISALAELDSKWTAARSKLGIQ